MWIFIGIVAFLVVIITTALLLPVNIIVKNGENGEFTVRYKILHKTFGGEPSKPNSPVAKAIKQSLGISRIEGKALKQTAKDKGLLETVSGTCHLISSLIKEIVEILNRVTIKKFHIDILTTGEDAAKTALNYGGCCVAVYPICGFINSKFKVKENAQKINISSGFDDNNGHFYYDIVISVRVSSVLARLIKLVWNEAMRTVKSAKN